MSDSSAPVQPAASEPAGPQTAPSEAPAEWKPEPRTWTWKDLFTAPMLAFKPKCMLVSAVTVIALLLWWMALLAPIGSRGSIEEQLRYASDTQAWHHLVVWIWTAVSLVIFGLGATLVATFLKADLLDDEFLSFGEAIAQYKSRLLAAVLVPLVLLVLVTGFWGLLWGGQLVCGIPYAGAAVYVLAYPVAFAFALLAVLVTVACALGLFLFPGIVAVRRHGWFDNVVDTVEAVGTKPHLLVAAVALTTALTWVAWNAGSAAMGGLNGLASQYLPYGKDNHLVQTENAAAVYRTQVTDWFQGRSRAYDFNAIVREDEVRLTYSTWAKITGWGVAGWQLLIVGLLVGYCLNLVLSGGLLTYLWVREDDYWDDEDLQDLDKLAKELEEEAKAEEAKAAANQSKTQATTG